MNSSAGSAVTVRLAERPDDLAAHHAVRHAVFVQEQHAFDESDRDARDADALHVVAVADGLVVGVVRLYPTDDAGRWRGDRLAVLPEARTLDAGALLVRFAVRTAGARGGTMMDARVQVQNVRFFQRLGWTLVGDIAEFHGLPHQQMEIPLTPAPPAPGG